jgi:hypothetical protein
MDSSEPFMPPVAFSGPSKSEPEQPQQHGILPSDGKQREARWYTEEDWKMQRPKITELYETNTLGNIMDFMREQHGLKATLGAATLKKNQ